MAEGGKETISSQWNCSICYETYRRPKLLPCHHTFCALCLQNHIENSTKDNTFECPICRKSMDVPRNGVEDFQTNFYITATESQTKETDTVQVHPCDICGSGTTADHHCLDCEENFCSSCTVYHLKMKATKHHKLLELGCTSKDERRKIKSRSFCKNHPNEEIKIFCQVCDKFLCLICSFTEHQGHSSKDVSKEAREIRERLRSAVDSSSVKARIATLEDNLYILGETNTSLEKRLQDDIHQLKENATRLQLVIDAEVKEMENELKEIYQNEIQKIKENERSCQTMIDSCRENLQRIKKLLDASNDVEMMNEGRELLVTIVQEEQSNTRRLCMKKQMSSYKASGQFDNAIIRNLIGIIRPVNPIATVREKRELELLSAFKNFICVYGICPVADQKAWISDFEKSYLTIIDSSGDIHESFDLGTTCDTMTVDDDDRCIVTCPGDKTIKRISLSEEIETIVSGLQNYPHGVAYSETKGQKELWFTCSDAARANAGNQGDVFVVPYDELGIQPRLVCSAAGNMSRIAVDRFSGNICVSSYNNSVQVFTRDGEQIGSYSSGGFLGVTFDEDGSIVVASNGEQKVLRLTGSAAFSEVLLKQEDLRSVAIYDDLLWLGLGEGTIKVYQM